MSLKAIIPLVLFITLCVLFLATLDRNTRLVPSPLIDQTAPATPLSQLGSDQAFTPSQMQGQRWIMNVWASWCQACRQEHDLLLTLAQQKDIQLIGYNYKDTTDKARSWLTRLGNPYKIVIEDKHGQAGLDWGIYGVPETYLIDEFNQVRYKHVGPLDQQTVNDTIMPFLRTGQISP